MWSPTHVQVVVLRARNLLHKGKGGTNDAYVTIQLGKEKFQTTVKERAVDPEWVEECDLSLNGQNSGEIILTVFHRNFFGLDEFLGQVSIPLSECDPYERSRNRWFPLRAKPNKKEKEVKYRGELEVRLSFLVRSSTTMSGSLLELRVPKKKATATGVFKDVAVAVGNKLQKIPPRSRSMSLKLSDIESRPKVQQHSRCPSTVSLQDEVQSGDSPSGNTTLDSVHARRRTGSISEERAGWELEDDLVESSSLSRQLNSDNLCLPQRTKRSASSPMVTASPSLDFDRLSEASDISFSERTPSGPKSAETPTSEKPSRNFSTSRGHFLKKVYKPLQRSPSIPNADEMANRSKSASTPLISSIRHMSIPSEKWSNLFGTPNKPLTKSTSTLSMVNIPETESLHRSSSSFNLSPRGGGEKKAKFWQLKSNAKNRSSEQTSQSKQEPETPASQSKPSPAIYSVPETVSEKQAPVNGVVRPADQPDANSQRLLSSQVSANNFKNELLQRYQLMSHQELVQLVVVQQEKLVRQEDKLRDLEDYIDHLLVRVMESIPVILQIPLKSTCPR